LIVIPVVYTLLDDMVSYFTGTNENTAPEKQA